MSVLSQDAFGQSVTFVGLITSLGKCWATLTT